MFVISLPFVSGVAISVLCGFPWWTGAVSAAMSMPLIVMFAAIRKAGRPIAALLFFALGLMVGSGTGAELSIVEPFALAESAMESLVGVIREICFEGQNSESLVLALLTGRRNFLSPKVVASFRDSGASHILALSGLHLGVIYLLLSKLLFVFGNSRAGCFARAFLAVVCCGFYALMTGGSPSIVRAFLFILMNEILRLCPWRERRPLNILLVAASLQLLFAPMVIESLAFQLSYLAMLGIFMVYPRLEKWYPSAASGFLKRFDVARKIWNSVALSFSCQLFTAPLVWCRFGTFPEYFLLTNLIALPLSEMIIVSSVVAVCMQALFGCPLWMSHFVDTLVSMLVRALEIVSSM